MRLSEVLSRARVRVRYRGDAEIAGISLDSRRVTPGALFVCMPGMTRDSQSFLPDAAAKGASAALVYDAAGFEAADRLGLTPALIEDFDDSVWRICDVLLEHPTRAMKVVGVTGTNGKTTTAWLLHDLLRELGFKSAYLGTLGFRIGDDTRDLPNTTPFAVDLYNLLAEARSAGVQALAMEVSSHALAQRRVDGVEFDVGVFTNLTQDHLDFHGDMAHYEAAKWRLFTELPAQTSKPFRAAINVDDPVGRKWAEGLSQAPQTVNDGSFGRKPINGMPTFAPVVRSVVSYSSRASTEGSTGATLTGIAEEIGVDRIRLSVQERDGVGGVLECSLGGSYNVYNLLSVVAAARCLDIPMADILTAARNLQAVPGRFEPVPNSSGVGIIVDYAHTPDALEKLLQAVRALTQGRVLTVFGCGGDRDRSKRPEMARVASSLSDLTVVTSDNPRTEDPQAIVSDVEAGIVSGADSVTILDRPKAIAYAVASANPGDVVVIAGKGHENYQIIGREKIHMDDRELAREGLKGRNA